MARVTQQHIDARKQEILDAAAQLFTEKGVGNATMQEIAEAAGLSAGAIYRYFDGKDDLLQAFFKHCVTEGPVALINQAAPDDATAIERLRAAAHAVRDMWAEHGSDVVIGEMETVLAGARNPNEVAPLLRTAHDQIYAAIEEIITTGQTKGEISGQLDARALAMTLHAAVYGFGMMSLNAPEHRDRMFEMFDVLLDRLAPCPGWPGEQTLNDE